MNTTSEEPFLPVSPEIWERANAGEADAQFQVGECYANAFAPFACRFCGATVAPEQVETDCCPDCGAKYPFEKAILWYESAAKRNFPPAYVRLHVASFYGIGTKKNTGRSKQFHTTARQTFPKLKHPPVPPFENPLPAETTEKTANAENNTNRNTDISPVLPPIPKALTPEATIRATPEVASSREHLAAKQHPTAPQSRQTFFGLSPLQATLLALLWIIFSALAIYLLCR
jgi:hypothetical protein